MRRLWLFVTVVLATAALAAGDVVYLRGGKMLRGKVSKEGSTIVVRTEAGETKVPASEVVHIVYADEPAGSGDKPAGGAESRPAAGDADEPPAAPVAPVSADGVVNPAATERGFLAEQAVMPEAMVFALERIMARTDPGASSFYLRQEIDRGKSTAHERKRRCGTSWFSPRDFATRRAAYVKKLTEAEDLINKAARLEHSKIEKDIAQRRALLSSGNKRLQEAAELWADSLLRRYLLGMAALYGGDPDTAEPLLASCAKDAPLVAGFQQGHGMALVEQKRALLALGPYIEMMRLCPDPRATEKQVMVDLVEKASRLVPGYRTRTRTYQTGQELLAKLKQAKSTFGFSGFSSARKGEPVLLMPDPKGRSWQSRTYVLPIPPYDRLVFRQAVGVPAGNDALIVDAKAAKDAMEIYVQIDSNTVVPAQLEKPRSGDPADGPLTMVRVKGCVFGPLTLADALPPAKNTPVLLFTTDFLSEMGNRVRTMKGKVVSIGKDGKPEFTVAVAAGEGTSPVLAGEGVLAGYLTGRTDVAADQCGAGKFVGPADVEYLFKAAKGERSSFSGLRRTTGTPPPAPQGQEVKGRAFLVYFIGSELLE